MPIPPLTPQGVLPAGIHPATIAEVDATFCTNPRRRELLEGLRRALRDLIAAGCSLVFLDGSFVTSKQYPGDYDLCWELAGVDVDALTAELEDTAPPRAAQQALYRGDILPNLIERSAGRPLLDFFQNDTNTGQAKGILSIDLRGVTP